MPNVEVPEQRAAQIAAATMVAEPELLLRFSTLHRLLRVTAWCRRWRSFAVRAANTLQPSELDDALMLWIGVAQQLHYPVETTAANLGRSVPSRSQLTKLTPFRDENGLLRVGGRFKHALLSLDERHPLIIPP